MEVTVTCLCRKNDQKLSLASSIPAATIGCSCNTCRHSTGVLYVSYLPLALPPRSTAGLTTYHSSPNLSRHFCSVCGSHMFIHSTEDDRWQICTGVIDRVSGLMTDLKETGLEKPRQHEFVADTIDGGIAVCLSEHDGRPVPFFARGPDEPEIKNVHGTLSFPTIATQPHSPADQRLRASCHCGGVQFHVTRPTAESRSPFSPYPDLLVPYHSSSSANPNDEKWWLRDGEQRYLAGTCACRSCRIGSGFPVQAWAFIPKVNLFRDDGEPLAFDDGSTSMKQYESSKGVFREFCCRCGATAFWHCNERPDLIDVSIGLLRAEEGARAESWLCWWTGRVSFKEEAFDVKLINALEFGLRKITK